LDALFRGLRWQLQGRSFIIVMVAWDSGFVGLVLNEIGDDD
jgi:hypothetical protein